MIQLGKPLLNGRHASDIGAGVSVISGSGVDTGVSVAIGSCVSSGVTVVDVTVSEEVLCAGSFVFPQPANRMDAERIAILYQYLFSTAEKKSRNLEILFHPGQMLASEATPEIAKNAANDFYLSKNRNSEKKGARCIRNIINHNPL